jgi:hypothetical protein
MLPDRTTTMGDDEAVMMDRPFQSMNAVDRTRAKLSVCVMVWRTLASCGEMPESMMVERIGKGFGDHDKGFSFLIGKINGLSFFHFGSE